MTINLTWAQYPESDVASYKVYRSIIGFISPIPTPGSVSGKTLLLKMNGGATQTITFAGVTAVIDQINAVLTGGRAYASLAVPTNFILRSDVRSSPGSVQIVGGTALGDLSQTARTITEKSENHLLATVAALVDPEDAVTYIDVDGVIYDWYALSTVDSLANESLKTSFRQPITMTGDICVLEGIVTDLQGVRCPDVEVTAKLIKHPYSPTTASHVTVEQICTLTGPDGRFSLPLLQGALVEIEIKEVEFTKNIKVPAKPYEFITNLEVNLNYRYPLGLT